MLACWSDYQFSLELESFAFYLSKLDWNVLNNTVNYVFAKMCVKLIGHLEAVEELDRNNTFISESFHGEVLSYLMKP